jgi:tRNA-2-methylthio-N6-dimethylallyladenosine synthase
VKRVPERTYYIETYGCQMNEHDSEKMAAMLEGLGLTEASSPEGAEVVVINTCSIREKAEHKLYSALGRLKPLKVKNPGMVTVVAGCVAQQEKDKLLKKASHLDVVLGTHCISELPTAVRQVTQTCNRVALTDFQQDVDSLHLTAPGKGPSPVCSYVTIMQGCSNFCSYCVVPFTRGPEQSRSLDEIIAEVGALAAGGVREVTLLGQNVNAYGNDLGGENSFSRLLTELDRIGALRRIRFTTSHPRDFNKDLAVAMARLESVCEHIHLPLQSGSDSILRTMKRGYTLTDYLEKIRVLREAIPSVAVTADMIVGFPGETDEDFSQTLEALEQIRFDQIFSFKYSPRPGTAARNLPDQVSEEVKADRLSQVHQLQDRITASYHLSAEGTVEEVLIEGSRPGTGQPFGRTRGNKIVNLEPDNCFKEGDLVKVKIVRGLKHSLRGKMIE